MNGIEDIYDALDHLNEIMHLLEAEEIKSIDDDRCYDLIVDYVKKNEEGNIE